MTGRNETVSAGPAETLAWILENPHHRGYWTSGERFFVLEGRSASLRIPVGLHVPGLMEPDDVAVTGRMYRPSPSGRDLLAAAG